jgi:signal transduction histidine kinase
VNFARRARQQSGTCLALYIVHGLLEAELTEKEVNSMLRDIVQILQARFTEAGVDSKLDLDKNLSKVRLDANHVEQIFMGLITNALEATPNGGSVTIRTRIEPGNGASPKVTVSVEDTGEGIPLENRQRVSEPFFTTKTHGTGIGLPLA